MSDYAGKNTMERLARQDARKALRRLIDGPRGTHCGRATPDSIAYVTELQRIFSQASERRGDAA
jgi:hypothetical protein